MKYTALILLLSCLSPLPNTNLFAVDAELPRKVQELLKTEHDKHGFHGVVLVASDGTPIYHEAFGNASADGKTALRKDSVFRLASVAKSFTGMSILLLEDEGKISADDDVRKYLPELPYEGITIRHLVHHTGGLPDYVTLLEEHWDVDKRGQADRRIATSPDALAALVKHKPAARFAPGDRWEYSNTGYVMLALVVEKVSGQRFGDFLADRIFKPLGMDNTVLFTPLSPPEIENRAFGHSTLNGKVTPNDENFLNGMYGDGEVYSTAEDLLRWDQALYGDALVSKEKKETLFRSGRTNDGKATGYGYGWSARYRAGKRIIAHAGGWVGFRTRIVRNVTDKTTLIVLTNSSNARFGKVANRLFESLLASSDKDPLDPIRDALTFHASFDETHDALFAYGDPQMYTSPTGNFEDGNVGELRDDVELAEKGKFGGSLRFKDNSKAIVYYRGKDNIRWQKDRFDGTYSFWLSLDPATDLKPGFSDPLQTTDKKWNDSSFFVDFSKENPRDFRLGAFSDFKTWNAADREFDDIPDAEKPMVFVKKPPFAKGEWTHVAFTYSGFNRGDDKAVARLYLNGALQGELHGRYHYTWDLKRVRLMLGLSYIGQFDDLAVFDRALDSEEIKQVYELENGIRTLGKKN